MTGPKELMVTQSSAERISNLVRDIEHLPSYADHRGLVRFEHAQDSRYESMKAQLQQMATMAGRAGG